MEWALAWLVWLFELVFVSCLPRWSAEYDNSEIFAFVTTMGFSVVVLIAIVVVDIVR